MHLLTKLSLVLLTIPVFGNLPAKADLTEKTGSVTFPEALQRALAADPRLPLQDSLAEAAEGQIEQADLRPNPVVGAEAENFLGTGPLQGVDALEVTLGISQTIETADKRARRTELARAERRLVDWDRERILADIESEVRSAFVEVLLAQQLVELRREQVALAERSATETERLVEAARSNQVEATRARLAVRRQTLALEQAERGLASAQTVLASFWGDTPSSDFTVEGGVQLEGDTPEFAELVVTLPRSVAIARFDAELKMREAVIDLEQALATPDFDIFGGARYFNEDDGEAAFLAGIEVPWPLFDQNQGNIRTARAQRNAVTHEREAQRRTLLIALNQAYQALVLAQADAKSIQADLLPAAEATLRDTETGYERGQFTLLSVLDSRQALFEIREAYLDALSRYAVAQSRIEALTRPASIQN